MPYYTHKCNNCGLQAASFVPYEEYGERIIYCVHCGSEEINRTYIEPTPVILKGEGWTTRKEDDRT